MRNEEMVNFELNRDACEGKACYSNFTSNHAT